MSRSRKVTADDSLDMLLDTITNTFGGIVFLAMLIVMMTGSSNPHASETKDLAEFREFKHQLDDLKQRQQELAQSRSAQQIVASFSELDIDKATANRIRGLARQYLALRKQLGDIFSNRIGANQNLRNGLSEKHFLNRRITFESKTHEVVAAEMERQIADRTVQVDLPREQTTGKSQTLIEVVKGKVYLVDKNLGQGDFEINHKQFTSCNPEDAYLILATGSYRPRFSAGVEPTDETGIRSMLAGFRSSELYLTVVIYDDSFDAFHGLRDVLRTMDIEHELVLMKAGEKISESPRKNEPKVQN